MEWYQLSKHGTVRHVIGLRRLIEEEEKEKEEGSFLVRF